MRRVKRRTLKRYNIPKQRPSGVPSNAPAKWVNIEGTRYNQKTKWWDGVPEDAIPYRLMDHVKPGFRRRFAPITPDEKVCDCRDRKQPGSIPSMHAADCDYAPMDYGVSLEAIKGSTVKSKNK